MIQQEQSIDLKKKSVKFYDNSAQTNTKQTRYTKLIFL